MLIKFVFWGLALLGAEPSITSGEHPLDSIHLQRLQDSADLKTAREAYAQELTKNRIIAAQNFSDSIQKFAQRLFVESCNKINFYDIALIILGSVARGEASPYTDFECLFLINQDSVISRRQSHKIMQMISDRLILAGETRDTSYKGFYCDEGGFTPPYNPWFYRYANPGARSTGEGQFKGRRDMVVTPESLRDYFSLSAWNDFKDTTFNQVLPSQILPYLSDLGADSDHQAQAYFYAHQMMRAANGEEKNFRQSIVQNWYSHMFVAGNRTIYDRVNLKPIIETILRINPDYPKFGFARIKEFLRKYKKRHSTILNTNMPLSELDFKQQIYRPVEQFLTGLGEVHQIPTINCFKILSELQKKNVVSFEVLCVMQNILSFGLCLNSLIQFKHKSHKTYLSLSAITTVIINYFENDKKRILIQAQISDLSVSFASHLLLSKQLQDIDRLKNYYWLDLVNKVGNETIAHSILYFFSHIRPQMNNLFEYMRSIVEDR